MCGRYTAAKDFGELIKLVGVVMARMRCKAQISFRFGEFGHGRHRRSSSHNLHKGVMDFLPRLREVERQRTYTVAVRGEFNCEVARGARVK